jgi:hypothetical protein
VEARFRVKFRCAEILGRGGETVGDPKVGQILNDEKYPGGE